MAVVRLSPRAQADIDDVLVFLTRNAGSSVAQRYGRRFGLLVDLIEEFPRCGTPRPSFGKNLRMLVEFPYLLFYEVEGERVSVLRILDGRRRITRKLVQGAED